MSATARWVILAVAISICVSGPAAAQRNLATIRGPEDDGVLQRARGNVTVAGREEGGLVVVSLPSLKQRVIRPPEAIGSGIQALGGPDRTGRIFYFLHSLRTISIDGSGDSSLFDHHGGVMDRLMGDYLGVAPDGGKAAFVAWPQYGAQITNHGRKQTALREGQLEIWDLTARRSIQTGVTVLDHRLSWFPDGSKLMYTSLLPSDKVPSQMSLQIAKGGFAGWNYVPVATAFDLATGQSDLIYVGWGSVISPNGSHLLIEDSERNTWLVSLKSRQAQQITLPGRTWRSPIAFVGDDLVLYWAVPTEGEREGWTKYGSPLVGSHRKLTLKIADFRTGKFKTVFGPLDPRALVAFGIPAKN